MPQSEAIDKRPSLNGGFPHASDTISPMKLLLFFLAITLSAQTYDLVIANGRVIDPETNLDAPRGVGISGGTVRAVSTKPLQGRATIDAKGLVVAPGFIDLHEHGQDF